MLFFFRATQGSVLLRLPPVKSVLFLLIRPSNHGRPPLFVGSIVNIAGILKEEEAVAAAGVTAGGVAGTQPLQ